MDGDGFKNVNIDNNGENAVQTEHQSFILNAKRFLCIVLAVTGIVGAIFGLFIGVSKYLEAFTGFRDGSSNLLHPFVYQLINLAAFAFLSVFAFICVGIRGRENKLKAAKTSYKRDKNSFTDVYKEMKTVKSISKVERSIKTANTLLVLFAVLAGISFVGLFIVSGLARTVIELSKDLVDRNNGPLRIILDCVGQGLFTFSVVAGLFIVPKFMKEGIKINKIALIIIFALSVFPAIHYAYFFFGNITAHASPEDLAAAFVPLVVCGFIGVYFADEARKKVINDFGSNA